MMAPKCQCKQSLGLHISFKKSCWLFKCHLHCFKIFSILKHIIQLHFMCYRVNSSGKEDLWLLFNRENLKEMLVISQLLKKSNNCIHQWAGKHSEMLRIFFFFEFEKYLLKSTVIANLLLLLKRGFISFNYCMNIF